MDRHGFADLRERIQKGAAFGTMLLRIAAIIFPIFAISALGYLYGRWKRPDISAANQMNMDVFVPALVFSALTARDFDILAYDDLALATGLVVVGSGLLCWPLLRPLAQRPATFLPPMMFNNSGNMGIPLAVFAFGSQALQAAVVMFLVSNLLHFTVGVRLLDHRAPLLAPLRMPVILATLAGLAISLAGITLPQPLTESIELLGQVSIPLLLFTLGVRLTQVRLHEWRVGLIGAVIRPVSGVLIALLVLLALPLESQQARLLLVFGALPPAVLNYVLAEQYRQDPERVAAIVMLGNLGSLLFIPAILAIVLR